MERRYPPPAPGISDGIYEVRMAAGQMAFFAEGRAWQLGGPVSDLQVILRLLGVRSETSIGPLPGYEDSIEKTQAEWDANVEGRRDRRARDAMQQSHLAWRRGLIERPRSLDEMREYAARPYMQLDEMELRLKLSPGYPTFLLGPCLPLWVAFDWTDHNQASAYSVLRKFIEALGLEQIHGRVLLELAFEYRESLGESDVRNRWASSWR